MPEAETLANISGVSPPAAAPAPAPQSAPQSTPPAAQRIEPGTPEWAALTQEQRHAQLRGPDNPRSRGHSPARDQREAAAGGRQDAPPADQQPEAPATKFMVGKYEVSEGEIGELMAEKAARDLKKATLPEKPEAYEAKLPADIKLPGGQTYTFDQNDPSLAAARNWAHAKGLSQDEFSQLLGIYASHVAGQEAILAQRSRAEIEKVGINAPQRLDAVGRFITAEMGETDAKQIRALIVTDSMLRYHERIIQRLTSQGSASFSQQHRVPADEGGIPGFEKMTFEQKRFAQDQRAARGR